MQDSPILQRIGYTGKYGLIASGYITRVIPDWNGNDTIITFTFQPFLIPDSLDNVNTTPYELSVVTGENVIPKYKAIYKSIGGNERNLNMGTTPIVCTNSYNQKIYNVADLSNTLKAQHNGVTLNKMTNGYILSSLLNKTIKLSAGDFLMQPSLVKFGTIALTLQMRADIIINDVITLPQEIFVGITALEKDTPTTGTIFQQKTIFSLFHGDYTVTGVWQLGDSRNTDPQAWATILECVTKS